MPLSVRNLVRTGGGWQGKEGTLSRHRHISKQGKHATLRHNGHYRCLPGTCGGRVASGRHQYASGHGRWGSQGPTAVAVAAAAQTFVRMQPVRTRLLSLKQHTPASTQLVLLPTGEAAAAAAHCEAMASPSPPLRMSTDKLLPSSCARLLLLWPGPTPLHYRPPACDQLLPTAARPLAVPAWHHMPGCVASVTAAKLVVRASQCTSWLADGCWQARLAAHTTCCGLPWAPCHCRCAATAAAMRC
jgi:hypothetical protein